MTLGHPGKAKEKTRGTKEAKPHRDQGQMELLIENTKDHGAQKVES